MKRAEVRKFLHTYIEGGEEGWFLLKRRWIRLVLILFRCLVPVILAAFVKLLQLLTDIAYFANKGPLDPWTFLLVTVLQTMWTQFQLFNLF